MPSEEPGLRSTHEYLHILGMSREVYLKFEPGFCLKKKKTEENHRNRRQISCTQRIGTDCKITYTDTFTMIYTANITHHKKINIVIKVSCGVAPYVSTRILWITSQNTQSLYLPAWEPEIPQADPPWGGQFKLLLSWKWVLRKFCIFQIRWPQMLEQLIFNVSSLLSTVLSKILGRYDGWPNRKLEGTLIRRATWLHSSSDVWKTGKQNAHAAHIREKRNTYRNSGGRGGG